MKKTKKMAAVVCCLLALAIGCSVSAYALTANQTWYVMTEPNQNGKDVYLDARKKEYTQVGVYTSGKASVSVSLWEYRWGVKDTWYGDNQTLSYGSDRRVWWYGGDSANYHIYAKTSAKDMTLSGYFRNYY